MHAYEKKLLALLKGGREARIDYIEGSLGIGKDAVLWAAENLVKKDAVSMDREVLRSVEISEEGRRDISEFPEEALAKRLSKSRGREKVSEVGDKVGLSWAKKNGWVAIDNGYVQLTDAGREAVAKGDYGPRALLAMLGSGKDRDMGKLLDANAQSVDMLVKRGLVSVRTRSSIAAIRITDVGLKLLLEDRGGEGIGVLTKEMIKSGAWRERGFKPYDVHAEGEKAYPARAHPLREFINFVRAKWLEMGFVEVSGPIVESAFWNFDALFSPQDHPTREMQDTFFLSNPKQISIEDIELIEKVRHMHTEGWKEAWMEEVARQAVLRTHTTSVSAHYIRKLSGVVNANYPLKLFSIGQVFRNESIDYKHLAELHQYDGIIIGSGLTLANLIDTLKKFYGKLGFDNVRIRPSYFPFTEPSLEAFYYDEEHGDSIELTGGGLIRKEITRAMGTDKTVLAWGGGIERLMINSRIFGLDSILTPYKNNIGWLRSRKNLKV